MRHNLRHSRSNWMASRAKVAISDVAVCQKAKKHDPARIEAGPCFLSGCEFRVTHSASRVGGQDKLTGRIAGLGELQFYFRLRKLASLVVALAPDLIQIISATHGVKDQFC